MATRKYHRKTNTFRKTKKRQKKKDKYLFDAIKIGNIDKVENALKNGANVNAKNDAGDTPLIRAINFGDIDMVELLLEYPNINVNAKNDAGDTPLIRAFTTSDNDTTYDTKYEMVQLLLDQPGIEFDINTVILAEKEEEDDQDQGGIPYLIENYIETKNKIKKQKDDNIKELSNYKRPNISSLKTMTYQMQPSALDTYINRNPGTMNRPYGKLGGKRKTRKIKSKKSKRKSKRH